MTSVYPMLIGSQYKTEVWISERARSAFAEYTKREQHRGSFGKRLKRYATDGFRKGWLGTDRPIRPEGDGVFRIGHDSTAFRLFGFFSKEDGTQFIVMDWWGKKSGDGGLSQGARECIRRVSQVKESKSWRLVTLNR